MPLDPATGNYFEEPDESALPPTPPVPSLAERAKGAIGSVLEVASHPAAAAVVGPVPVLMTRAITDAGGDKAKASADTAARSVEPGEAPSPAPTYTDMWNAWLDKQQEASAPQRFVTTPGGMIPKSRTEQLEREGAPASPFAQAQYMRGAALEAGAEREAARYEGGYRETVGKLVEQKNRVEQDFAKGQEARQQLFERVVGDHRARIKRQWDDIRESKIDPKRYFRDPGVGRMILAGLGSLLGGIGAGLTGRPNAFLAAVERNVDRDIAAQEKDLSNRKEAARESQNALDMFMKIHGDAEQAKLALKTAQMMTVQNALESLAAQHQGTMAGVQYKRALAGIQQRVAKYVDEQEQRAVGKVTQQATDVYQPPRAVAVGPKPKPQLSDEQLQARTEKAAGRWAEQGQSERLDIVENFTAALGGVDANKAQDFIRRREWAPLHDLITRKLKTDPAAAQRIEFGVRPLVKKYQGVLSPGEKPAAEAMVDRGDPASVAAAAAIIAEEYERRNDDNFGENGVGFVRFMAGREASAAQRRRKPGPAMPKPR